MNLPARPWIAYPPALSNGSPVARYSSISSADSAAKCTDVTSTKLRRSISGNRINATPVITEWVFPDSISNICRASSVVRGFPRICVPISTAVSAAITIAGPTDRAATSSAFASASRATIASADSLGIGVSSIADDITENAYPALCKISARRGEADANMSFVALTWKPDEFDWVSQQRQSTPRARTNQLCQRSGECTVRPGSVILRLYQRIDRNQTHSS